MTSETIIPLLMGGFAAVGTIIAAFRAGRAAEHTPYSALADRVVALEQADRENRKRIARLEASENKLLEMLDQLIRWADGGAAPPPPAIPEEIRYLIDRRYK